MSLEQLKSELLEYEIASSFFLTLIPFGHDWIARYFLRKVERKLRRVALQRQFLEWQEWREASGLSHGYGDFRKWKRSQTTS